MNRSTSLTVLALLLASTSACGDDGEDTNAAQGSVSSGAGGAGASGSAASSGAGATSVASSSASGSGGGPMCQFIGSSSLPDVKIEVLAQGCTFTLAEAAAGITVDYQVVVENDVTGVIPAPQDAGGCSMPGPSGLILFEKLSGNGQTYCVCDQGLCPGPPMTPVTLSKGTYPAQFMWDGKSWMGPSDTGNPKGPPFPVGVYDLEISAKGLWKGPAGDTNFTVLTTWPITLVP